MSVLRVSLADGMVRFDGGGDSSGESIHLAVVGERFPFAHAAAAAEHVWNYLHSTCTLPLLLISSLLIFPVQPDSLPVYLLLLIFF